MKLIRNHYLDASAIVKLVLNEPGSVQLREYFRKEFNFATTSLCFAEALGVLKVKRFNNKCCMTDDDYFSACDELMAWVSFGRVEIEEIEMRNRSVFAEVEELTRKHNKGKSKGKTIDISDAFQIVSVKWNYFSRFPGTDAQPMLITGDRALTRAARDERLWVWNCIDERPPEEITEE